MVNEKKIWLIFVVAVGHKRKNKEHIDLIGGCSQAQSKMSGPIKHIILVQVNLILTLTLGKQT